LIVRKRVIGADGDRNIECVAYDLASLSRICEDYARVASIFAASHAMFEIAANLTIVRWNRAAESLYELSESDAMGLPISAIVGADDADEVARRVKRVIETGETLEYEAKLRTRTGKEIDVHVLMVPVRNSIGERVGAAALVHDVGAQRALEAQLREAHAYTRGLIESSLDAMVVVDADLQVKDVNEQMAKLCGVAKDQLIGSRFDTCFTDPNRAAAGVNQTLSAGYVANYDLTLKRPDGRTCWCRSTPRWPATWPGK
jgi:PAS domain S-box-containing protein